MRRFLSLKYALGSCFALAFAVQVHAVPITGTISYVSGATPNNADLNLVTGFAFDPAGLVVSATGDLTAVGAFVLNAPGISGLPLGTGPAGASVPIANLWSGGGFSFELTSLTIDFRSATQFTASGAGILTGVGSFDPTPGSWTLAITGEGSKLGFAAGTGTKEVADTASSALLGALGLVGMILYCRKKN